MGSNTEKHCKYLQFVSVIVFFSICRICHENLRDMTKIRKCSCKRLAKARFDYYSESKEVHCNGYDRAFLAGYFDCHIKLLNLLFYLPRFKGLSSSQSIREKSSSVGTKDLRLRKSSQTELDKNGSDDEIVESCKVRHWRCHLVHV